MPLDWLRRGLTAHPSWEPWRRFVFDNFACLAAAKSNGTATWHSKRLFNGDNLCALIRTEKVTLLKWMEQGVHWRARPERIEWWQSHRTEADSRLNNDSMKGEGTVRLASHTCPRTHNVTSNISDKQLCGYIYCPIRKQDAPEHWGPTACSASVLNYRLRRKQAHG